MENLASHHFFEYLITEGIITNEQLSFVLEEARHQQVSFISCLRNDKTIDPSRLLSGLSHVFCLPTVDLDSIDPLQLPGDVIEERLLQKYQVLPLWQEKEKLGLAIADPTQQLAIDDISFHTGLIIEKILVEPEKLKQLLAKVTKKPDFPQKRIDERDKNADSEIAVIQTVSQLLQSAIERGASDIHV